MKFIICGCGGSAAVMAARSWSRARFSLAMLRAERVWLVERAVGCGGAPPVMDGLQPPRVPDNVIDKIRLRERAGAACYGSK
jgi:hypothetical protein